MASTMVTRPVSGFWRYYCLQLDRRPLLTRSLTGLIGGALGDAAAQMSERATARRQRRHAVDAAALAAAKHPGARTRHPHDAADGAAQLGAGYGAAAAGVVEEEEEVGPAYDWVRTLRLALWNAVVGAPLGYKWYQLIDGRVYPGCPTSPRAVLVKTLLDQLIMAPFGTALFFLGIKTLEGSPHLAFPTLRDKYPTAMAANYTIWPLAHIVNFKFVPASQRILYVNAVAVVWTAVLSHLVDGHAGAGHRQHRKQA